MLKSNLVRSKNKRKNIHRHSMQRSCKWKRWSHQKISKPSHARTTDRFGAANPGMNPHEPIPKTGNPKRAKNQPTPGPPLGWVKRGGAFRQSCTTTFFTVDRRSTRSWKMVRPDLRSDQVAIHLTTIHLVLDHQHWASLEPPAGPNDCGGPADAGVPWAVSAGAWTVTLMGALVAGGKFDFGFGWASSSGISSTRAVVSLNLLLPSWSANTAGVMLAEDLV